VKRRVKENDCSNPLGPNFGTNWGGKTRGETKGGDCRGDCAQWNLKIPLKSWRGRRVSQGEDDSEFYRMSIGIRTSQTTPKKLGREGVKDRRVQEKRREIKPKTDPRLKKREKLSEGRQVKKYCEVTKWGETRQKIKKPAPKIWG